MFVQKGKLHLFHIPWTQSPFLFPQFLKPESTFEKVSLISSFIFSKYRKFIENSLGISSTRSKSEFLERIPIKTLSISLVHNLNDSDLEALLLYLKRIKSLYYIRKTCLFFLLLPFSALMPAPLGSILGMSLMYLSFKSIRETRGSLVLERIIAQDALETIRFNLHEISDQEKFKEDNNLHLL